MFGQTEEDLLAEEERKRQEEFEKEKKKQEQKRTIRRDSEWESIESFRKIREAWEATEPGSPEEKAYEDAMERFKQSHRIK